MPLKTTKYPGWRLEYRPESSTPPLGRPEREAARARASANERPALVGIDSSTTVNPFCEAGQEVSKPGALDGGAVVAGGGEVGGGVVSVGVPDGTLGSATVSVAGGVVGVCGCPPVVATIVPPPPPFDAPRTIAAVAPATAMTRPTSTGQIQSPGYELKRPRHAASSQR